MLGAKILDISIGGYSAIGEWAVFIMSFYMYAVITTIMPYNDIVVPENKN